MSEYGYYRTIDIDNLEAAVAAAQAAGLWDSFTSGLFIRMIEMDLLTDPAAWTAEIESELAIRNVPYLALVPEGWTVDRLEPADDSLEEMVVHASAAWWGIRLEAKFYFRRSDQSFCKTVYGVRIPQWNEPAFAQRWPESAELRDRIQSVSLALPTTGELHTTEQAWRYLRMGTRLAEVFPERPWVDFI